MRRIFVKKININNNIKNNNMDNISSKICSILRNYHKKQKMKYHISIAQISFK